MMFSPHAMENLKKIYYDFNHDLKSLWSDSKEIFMPKNIWDTYKGNEGFKIEGRDIELVKQWNKALMDGALTSELAAEINNEMTHPSLKKLADGTKLTRIEMIQLGGAALIGATGLKGMAAAAKFLTIEIAKLAGEFALMMIVSAAIFKTFEYLGKLRKEAAPTGKELKGASEEAASAWEEVKSELESVNSELETTRDRIAELQSKGALTFTEQEELDRLKEENLELEKRIAFLQEEERIKRETATDSAYKTLIGVNGQAPVTSTGTYSYSQSEAPIVYGSNSYESRIQKEYELYKKYKEKKDNLDSKDKNFEQDLEKYQEKMQKHYDNMVTFASEANTELSNIDKSLLNDEQLEIVKQTEQIVNSVLLETGKINIMDFIETSMDEDKFNSFKSGIDEIVMSGEDIPDGETLLAKLGLTNEDLTSASISVDGLKKHILALRNAATSSAESNLADKFNLSGAITELTELETKFNTLTKAYEEFRDNDVVSLDSLDKISSQFGTIKDTDAFIEAMAVLSNSKSTLTEVEAAMNSLVNTYVDSKEVLNALNESNKELYISQLKEMGVVNALEVVEFRLAQKRLMNAEAGSEEAAAARRVIAAYSQTGEVIHLMGEEAVASSQKLALVQQYLQGISQKGFYNAIKSQASALLSVGLAAGKSAKTLVTYLQIYEKIAQIENIKGKDRTVDQAKELYYLRLQASQLEKQAYEEYNALFDVKLDYDYSPTSSSSYKPASGSNSDSDSKTNFDWIETAISRIQRAITNLEKQVGNTFKSWSTRNSALTKQLAKVREEITLQEAAYNAYMREANAIGLSSDWVKKIQSGAYNIDILKDKTLIEKIQNYKDWYEKALACQDAIEDLRIEESNLYKQKFDSIITKYDGYLGMIEHERTMLEDSITQTETKGYLVSAKYYEALIKAESENISNLQSKKNELISALNDALSANTIELYSEEWYNMNSQINDVTLAIQQGTTSLIEYGNAIRDLEWEVFDLLQDNISSITDEANFLVDLLSREKLHDDKGQLTDAGMSTMGLHGVNYNVLMAQADEYAKEVLDIDKALANDPNNQTLLERRKELLGLQQDSILAAEQERDAIKDLVSEGIQLELDALQELIDSYNEALDNRKELYEYEKKIAEQVKEVAKLEKQMVAYQGDSSEEAQSKIQQIKVSLEEARDALAESEYDKYISDQKALLDNLYLEYETVLNQRLDNIDLLMEDMVEKINQNADVISATILEATENVGYTLSESMNTIWNGEGTGISSVIVTYADKIAGSITSMETTVNAALNKIADKIQAMLGESDEQAAVDIPKDTTTNNSSSGSGSASGGGSHSSSSGNSSPTPSKNTADGTARIGDKVKFASGVYYADSYGGGYSGYYNRGKEVFITAINKSGSHPYHISTGSKLGVGDLGWLKLSQLAGYFRGKKNIGSSQFAWTQERGGEEYIIRPSDGAILTPLARGDSVLNAVASENLWSIANNPSDFIRDKMGSEYVSLVDKVGSSASYVQNLDKIIFNMPNVKNYDEILTELQRDKNFERLLNAMTIDMLVGGSSLAKNKAIRR